MRTRLRCAINWRPLHGCMHGPQSWPWWRLFGLSLVRLTTVMPPSTGLRLWIYTRAGGRSAELYLRPPGAYGANMSSYPEEQVATYCAQMGWARTGVFATAPEIEQCLRWKAESDSAPVARVHGVWLNEAAEDFFKRRVHGLAIEHGLPELANTPDGPDYYGIIVTGEFVRLATAVVVAMESTGG